MKGKGKSSAPVKPKVTPPPAPTKWTIDKTGAKSVGETTDSAKTNFDKWVKAVGNGEHPKTAADDWDSDYETLGEKTMQVGDKKGVKVNKRSIRLSKENRVYFYQIDSIKLVKVLKYGDHKPPSW